MDKQTIINGVDVSGCIYYQYNMCTATKDNYGDCLFCCKDYEMKDCHYKQLKRKEKECDQLKAEIEQEKALKETYLACYRAKHEDIEGTLFKLKQTLTEIKEIAKEQIPYLNIGEVKTMIEIEYDYVGAICNLEKRMYQILQKISEVK